MVKTNETKGICLFPACAGKKSILARSFPRHYRKHHQEVNGDGSLVEQTRFRSRMTKKRYFQPVAASLETKEWPVEGSLETKQQLMMQASVITDLKNRIARLEKCIESQRSGDQLDELDGTRHTIDLPQSDIEDEDLAR